MNTAMTADINTHTVVEGVRQDVQAQLEQNHADTLHREEDGPATENRQLSVLRCAVSPESPSTTFV